MNSNLVLINPYAKRPAAAASENNDRVNNVAINPVVTDFSPWDSDRNYVAAPLRTVKRWQQRGSRCTSNVP